MAKTISQSITSIETSETSLESSLSKCKTSISNKGVSVPSTTRFSNLPALIDKIDVESYEYTVSHPYADNYVTQLKVGLYNRGSLVEERTLNSGNIHTFTGLSLDGTYMVKYRENKANISSDLQTSTNDGVRLDPIIFIVVADSIDDIIQMKLTDANTTRMYNTFKKQDNFYWCQAYNSNGNTLLVEYRKGSQTIKDDLILACHNYPHTHFIYLNLANRVYSEYMLLSNDLNIARTNFSMRN